MASRLKWVKALLRQLIQDERKFHGRSDNGGLEGSSQSIRLFKYSDGVGSSVSSSSRVRSRAPPAHGAHNYLQNGRTLKEVVANLNNRVDQGFSVNSFDYAEVLQGCSKQKDLELVKQVHGCIRKSNLEQHPYVVSNLLKCYIGCGQLQNAQEIFNKLLKKDTVSWNIMIGGCAAHDQAEGATALYKKMRSEGGKPSVVTYLNTLKACANPAALKWGKDIHAHIIDDGFQADVRIGTALVTMYANCGSIEDARMVFDKMMIRDVISWNAIIGGLAQQGHGDDASNLFHQMQREGFVPDCATYLSILSAKADPKDLAWLKVVHSQISKSRLAQESSVNNALIHMYAKCGSVDDAQVVFNSMTNRNSISWNAMIGALAQDGRGLEAFSLFLQMQKEGNKPDPITYLNILNPCSSAGALEWVREIHAHAVQAGLDADLRVGTALAHMYAKIGIIADARQVFAKLLDRDVVSWTAMIGGLAQHGHGLEALQLFEEMKLEGVKPCKSLMLAVMSACNHAGLVDEGRLQFVSMTRDHGIEPALEHCNCMVDILGRAGHLEEAKLFSLNMPIKPDFVTWTTLLGVSKVHSNVELAELAAKACLKLEPMDPSPYVVLSNVYAAVGNWDQVSLIRSMMEERGIRKDPGRCWIEVDNKVHHFVAGDTSHPETRDIYAMLYRLSEKLKAAGYIPDTRLVLRNMEEEDKESSLSAHSEKLAISYGLMHVTPGKPIRIYKNLRICTDCHIVSKLISKITGREIVARDANRFHHFTDGSCSCGDFW